MSGHSHEEHHSAGNKPVSFTVPFLFAVATLIILFMFLSLCDPKAHHGAGHEAHGVEATAHGDVKHDAEAAEPAKTEAASTPAASSSEPEASTH